MGLNGFKKWRGKKVENSDGQDFHIDGGTEKSCLKIDSWFNAVTSQESEYKVKRGIFTEMAEKG